MTIRKIVAGPSKWDLATTFFNRKPMNTPMVVFTALLEKGCKQPIMASIESISVEDGSGDSWNMKGRCYIGIEKFSSNPPPVPVNFEAHFRTDNRKGHIGFTS